MGRIWNVIFSHEFIAGALLVLAVRHAVDGNVWWAAFDGALFIGNFALAAWSPKP